MTATELFARGHGLVCSGPGRCCYCGAPASDPHDIPDSFTAIDALAAPGSGVRCAGCALAMSATAGPSPDGKPWMWSWVLTPGSAARHALCPMLGGDRVRAGRAALRAACLSPPPPPYALVLCESGRTHTLYRAAVHRGGPGATLTLDGAVLRYDPAALARRIGLCSRAAAAWGPKVARDRLPVSAARWSAESLALIEEWEAVRAEPLTAAAACLFPDPEESP